MTSVEGWLTVAVSCCCSELPAVSYKHINQFLHYRQAGTTYAAVVRTCSFIADVVAISSHSDSETQHLSHYFVDCLSRADDVVLS
jgi:hypothetical protein